MTYEQTWLGQPDEERVVIRTNPQNMTPREYWLDRRCGVWVPSGYITGHALEYARMQLVDPVLDRRLADGQLQLTDFSETVGNRAASYAVA